MKSIYDDKYAILIKLLKHYRENSNMTQQELATILCEKDQSFVSKYENGQRRLDFIEVRNLCTIFGIDFVIFVTRFEHELKRMGLS